ncbi:Glycosyl transferase, group 1 [Lysobacter dokdonensis DS-58]|uniref:Glycosyl transferase, group 1 n=1 Tax=Lysobacter dokdonensis DS-58 TaxID=1300345 RepID=A0A0A2X6E5_9GAMM|nr:glycosyltransferase family 4 protein [Lysobacter dokdonensis]KGQ20809.1 Glycosyl transferase, group 1 [Lysobacter dokdonensis DS-58]
MRALFVTRKFPPSVGGMETWSKEFHAACVASGADVDLLKPASDHIGRPSLAQMAAFFASASWALVRHGRRYEAVLLGDFALATLAIVAKLATFGRIRTVVQLHGNDLYFMRQRGLVPTLYRALCAFVVGTRAIDATVANSRAIRDEAAMRGLPASVVVPLATHAPADDALVQQPRAMRLVFAGRLIRYKGLSWFVRTVWPKLDPTFELVVAGGVWDAEERACLEGDARIRYVGALDPAALQALRATAIACIMPNVRPQANEQDEGFGLAALESPAVGTPILASACGGLPDAVTDGVTGFLLPPGDADAWVACLHRVARWTAGERIAFGTRARAHILEHATWDRVARDTLAVLAARA